MQHRPTLWIQNVALLTTMLHDVARCWTKFDRLCLQHRPTFLLFSSVNKNAAFQVLHQTCCVRLGTSFNTATSSNKVGFSHVRWRCNSLAGPLRYLNPNCACCFKTNRFSSRLTSSLVPTWGLAFDICQSSKVKWHWRVNNYVSLIRCPVTLAFPSCNPLSS